jgi:glycopeptide antibiotics resistance protein
MTDFTTSKRKKFFITLSIIAVVTVAVFCGYKGMTLAASQSYGGITQSGDLCGGTGGNGQIVSVGNNEFTIRRNDNGIDQIVHLTGQATIKTPDGYVSASDLKIGGRVTLVGGPNRDGSFTADTVVVCRGTQEVGTQENGAGQANPLTVRKENTDYKKVSAAINAVTVLLFVLIWLGITTFLRLKKKKSLVYLLFFTIFYVYFFKVLDYTLFQFQSLLLLQHFVPDLMLRGVEAGRSLNLIPLATLRLEDVKTSLLNILFMMPFGFGLTFITDFRIKRVVIAGLLVSIVIEFLQFVTGFMANTTFRVADINDLIFNTAGVAIGYMLFVGSLRTYSRISRNWKIRANPILRYIAERPQIDK